MTTAHDFTLKTIDGTERALSAYQGKAMLIVNVASACGYTPQYGGLQALHTAMAARGLAVLGVPCNQFGAQEPGKEVEIATFCQKNYGVTFDLFSKVDVNGPTAHPLYQWLTSAGAVTGPVKWNFAKFVVDKRGNVVARFDSGTKPDSKELADAIATALA